MECLWAPGILQTLLKFTTITGASQQHCQVQLHDALSFRRWMQDPSEAMHKSWICDLHHISSHHVSCEVVKKDWTWLKCTVLSPDTIEWFMGLATVQEHHLPRSSVPNPLRWRSCQLLALRWAPQIEASSAKTKAKEKQNIHFILHFEIILLATMAISFMEGWHGRWILKTWKIQWHPYQHQHQSQAKMLDCSFVDVPKFGWFAPAPQPGRREDPSFLPLRPINKEW